MQKQEIRGNPCLRATGAVDDFVHAIRAERGERRDAGDHAHFALHLAHEREPFAEIAREQERQKMRQRPRAVLSRCGVENRVDLRAGIQSTATP